jgi:hypothetical protein
VKRAALFVLSFSLGLAVCWVYCDSREKPKTPSFDPAIKVITVKRTVDNDPKARNPVETHRLRIYRVSTGNAPSPPDGAKHESSWTISLTDGSGTESLTGTHYFATPE